MIRSGEILRHQTSYPDTRDGEHSNNISCMASPPVSACMVQYTHSASIARNRPVGRQEPYAFSFLPLPPSNPGLFLNDFLPPLADFLPLSLTPDFLSRLAWLRMAILSLRFLIDVAWLFSRSRFLSFL